MYTAAHSKDPFLKLGDTYYKREVGVGWIVVQREQAPLSQKFYPIPAVQWAIYRAGMVVAGHITEEKASEIAASLDSKRGKALETEKPNPGGVGLV